MSGDIKELIIHNTCGLPIELCECNLTEVIYCVKSDTFYDTRIETKQGMVQLTRHSFERFNQRFNKKHRPLQEYDFGFFIKKISKWLNSAKIDFSKLSSLKYGRVVRKNGPHMMVFDNNLLITYYEDKKYGQKI